MNKIKRSGWGRTTSSEIFTIPSEDFQSIDTKAQGTSGLPIGLGRSYGDSSLNSTGISWTNHNNREISIDEQNLLALCGAGATIGELERKASDYALFPPVVPGTEFVTIGGAIASDVHGKSHHSFGSISDHIQEISLIDSAGRKHVLSPKGKSEDLFWATVGGMGLTGIITSAKIKLLPIETSFFKCKEIRARNLSEVLVVLNDLDKDFFYTVAWIDFSGKYEGRGLVSAGNHARLVDLPSSKVANPFAKQFPKKIKLPDIFPSKTINKYTVRVFNEVWFRKPLYNGIKHFQNFLHPLDSLQNWNRVYGKNGLIQYQFQVPEVHEEFLFKVMEKFKSIDVASFLVVLKKFGSSQHGFLSFPKPGWTLAVDLPAKLEGLEKCLDELDDELVQLGGRIYLTKDQRLNQENFQKMYPEYQRWKKLKQEYDPENYWQSDQGRRLGLC